MPAPRQDDMRQLIEKDFPQLALQIAETMSLIDHRSWVHPSKHRFAHEYCDYSKGMWFHGVYKNSGGTDVYKYSPYGNDGKTPYKSCSIAFYKPSLVDVDDISVGTLNAKPSKNGTQTVTVDQYTNDGPTQFRRRVETEQEKEKEEEHSFGLTVGTEFRLRMSRSAGIDMKGFSASQDIEVEMEQRFEARTDHEWRKSDRLRSSVEDEYLVDPYMDWTLTTQRTQKDIEQDVFVTGILDCCVEVYVWNWFCANFDTIKGLQDVVGGITGRNDPIGWHFKNHPETEDHINSWHRPKLTLNFPIKGKRTRYSRAVSKQTPISGRDNERNRLDKLAGIDLDDLPDIDIDDLDMSDENNEE